MPRRSFMMGSSPAIPDAPGSASAPASGQACSKAEPAASLPPELGRLPVGADRIEHLVEPATSSYRHITTQHDQRGGGRAEQFIPSSTIIRLTSAQPPAKTFSIECPQSADLHRGAQVPTSVRKPSWKATRVPPQIGSTAPPLGSSLAPSSARRPSSESPHTTSPLGSRSTSLPRSSFRSSSSSARTHFGLCPSFPEAQASAGPRSFAVYGFRGLQRVRERSSPAASCKRMRPSFTVTHGDFRASSFSTAHRHLAPAGRFRGSSSSPIPINRKLSRIANACLDSPAPQRFHTLVPARILSSSPRSTPTTLAPHRTTRHKVTESTRPPGAGSVRPRCGDRGTTRRAGSGPQDAPRSSRHRRAPPEFQTDAGF